ncbi:MAG: 2-oxoglutarate dehydrogenase E1 component [Flavobacteriales bacterium]|nr:2-oxoglutarate dehydrogenase E1 component [Flavobacteriales bacterium]
MDKFSFLSNADPESIDTLFKQYLANPQSVDNSWKEFFDGFEFARKNVETTGNIPSNFQKEFNVITLINAYRSRGHLFTKTNPVRERRKYAPTLAIENFGLEAKDLSTVFQAGTEVGIGAATLSEIINHLELTYCQSIGIEYMYMRNPETVNWLRNKIELKNRPTFLEEDKKHIFKKLNQAATFEQFLHKKFVGQKRFSLEGGETLIPALDTLIEQGSNIGINEFIVGMAHRGRLNVLATIFNKPYENIFSEFEGKEYEDHFFDGDVKYHLGYSCSIKTKKGNVVNLTLSPNPSHLEAVNAVVEGMVRAKIDAHHNHFNQIVPVLIHGDAAIAAQGIVYEVIQMSKLKGYQTGGTVHIVINNQVGFTTNYIDGRSSTYCTDVAKVTLSPVFHVNGDDVEAVCQTVKIALEFRQRFNRDVFIDLLCYRKYGHNEGDEPRFTQPLLYKAIAKHPNASEIYLNRLVQENILTQEEGKNIEKEFNHLLQKKLEEAKNIDKARITSFLESIWKDIRKAKDTDFEKSVETAISEKEFKMLGLILTTLPANKKFFNKSIRLFEDRFKMLNETNLLDWAMGELMAYASLLHQGFAVRISGQDVERGTFSHRHAVVKVEDSEEEYIPLANIAPAQAPFYIYNSLLSEYGVLGYEYGYAMVSPKTLTVWEAQFGDFFNGAQIIIDQFISSAEEKWNTFNGLVMLLPHGYEGQGAEHSSARIERFLINCAENNMLIANCTSPANFFHLLRRQLIQDFRKPLIVFTPKSLLRHPKCLSPISDFTKGGFKEVIDDEFVNPKNTDVIAFCTGKIYYELAEKRESLSIKNLALIRIEQLYPFPQKQVELILKKYSSSTKFLWVQEEPENMGAWLHINRMFPKKNLIPVTLPASGSPATGSYKAHATRQNKLLTTVFDYAFSVNKKIKTT